MNHVQHQRIYLKGEDKTHSIKSIKNLGSSYQVTFNNGKTFRYNQSNVRIIDSLLALKEYRDSFTYLAELAKCTSLEIERNGKSINILSNHFKKIDFIERQSVLGSYLCGELTNEEKDIFNDLVIYPFGFNSSQKNAIDNALGNKVSVIEGPPGTGKTQTILNIISNCTLRGQSVAVVSNNNSAIKNVLEKLQNKNLSFMTALLGSNSNKERFIENQKDRICLSKWAITDERKEAIEKELKEKIVDLNLRLEQKNELAQLKKEKGDLELEREYFVKSMTDELLVEEKNFIKKNILKSTMALDSWFYVEVSRPINFFVSFLYTFLFFFSSRLRHRRVSLMGLRTYTRERLIEMLQYRFYELKSMEIDQRIDQLVKKLSAVDFQKEMSKYTDLSFELFYGKIYQRFQGVSNREFKLEDLYQEPYEFISHYPIVLSTTYSLKTSLNKDVKFDYVIVDESSQVDICTGALAMSCAKNMVIVGDLKQLPHVVDSNLSNITDSLFDKNSLSERYRYKDQNLLSTTLLTFKNVPKTLLREHYRCHPRIIEFCNKKFYNDKLIVMTEEYGAKDPLVIYRTVKGNHARDRINQRQIDMIFNEIIPQEGLDINDGSIGIISPYRKQTNELQKKLNGTRTKADTVDKFQGQERNVIILSTVDNNITKFSDDENRLNVAISRAKDQLIVLINDSDTINGTNIGDLVDYIRYNNMTIVQSEINSVFDYLYKSYDEERRKILIKSKIVSNFDSENLMNNLLGNILERDDYAQFSYSVHVPLRMIISDHSRLSNEEKRFVSNYLTHVDFLIFDKVNKKPKLIIEVDGTSYHKEGSKQSQRDKMKDSILHRYGLEILRLRTNESREENRIVERLDKIKKSSTK